MKVIEVNITEELIKNSNPLYTESCPVAFAIDKHIKSNFKSAIGKTDFLIYDDVINYSFQAQLPKKVILFINNYDTNNKVIPFSFKLKIPDIVLKIK